MQFVNLIYDLHQKMASLLAKLEGWKFDCLSHSSDSSCRMISENPEPSTIHNSILWFLKSSIIDYTWSSPHLHQKRPCCLCPCIRLSHHSFLQIKMFFNNILIGIRLATIDVTINCKNGVFQSDLTWQCTKGRKHFTSDTL